MLKRHLQEFSERLEETRERIEGATRCYQLLDKVRLKFIQRNGYSQGEQLYCFLFYLFPSGMESTLEGKGLLPWEKILCFMSRTFLKGIHNSMEQTVSHKSISLVKMERKRNGNLSIQFNFYFKIKLLYIDFCLYVSGKAMQVQLVNLV